MSKLKIVNNVTIYSTENTWNTYRDKISIIKSKILEGELIVSNVKYGDNFDEKYRPYNNKNNWGSNLDEYYLKLNSSMEASLSYYSISRYSSIGLNRTFKFEISFMLPKEMLVLFNSEIEREFYYKCCEIRKKELEQLEENRIKQIGRELLKQKKNE